jgi:hypothetical protein
VCHAFSSTGRSSRGSSPDHHAVRHLAITRSADRALSEHRAAVGRDQCVAIPAPRRKTVEDSVTQIIEQNMTGLDGLIYMVLDQRQQRQCLDPLTFASGTNPDIAQVQVQNKLQQALPLLPQIVQLQGISVSKSNSASCWRSASCPKTAR